ncbi:putative ankyrin 2,3/unc44, partial [Operophtera brumata]
HSRGRKILALVPNEHAPSDASDKSESECELHDTTNHYISESECELHDNSTHYSSSPPPSLGSIENLHISIYGPDSENEPASFDPPLSNECTKKPANKLDAILDTVPLSPILQEIRESNYENVPSSLSAIPSLPSTPATPLTTRAQKKRYKRPTLSANRLDAILDTVPLSPILQEIRESNYENVPSTLSAIPSLPSTPATPLTTRAQKKRYKRPTLSANRLDAILDTVPLSPILQEIRESNYENVPSTLSAIPSLPSTPATPLTTRAQKKRSKRPTLPPPKRRKKPKKFQLAYKWKKATFRHRAVIEEEDGEYVDLPEPDASPLTYFHSFFSFFMADIVEQSNFYSIQETGKSILLTEDEFDDFLAIHIIMGIVDMPSYLDYWSQKFKYAKVAEIMPLKRYQQIRRYLHFADNNMEDGDRYYKIRPLLEKIRLNCLKYQVIALCQSIKRKPAIIYCDNFFSSPELFHILRENYGIFALGTIRNNRLRGAEKVLPTEKEMKKKERGSYVEATCNQNRLAVVRWNDNKAVTFISSFVASTPVEKIQRY